MPDSPPDIRALHQRNKTAWNQGAEHYATEIDRDIAFLRAGGMNFCAPEWPYIARLKDSGARAIHLQCAGGRDTLSLWNAGAREVIGVDISDGMIAVAQAKSDALQAPARWFCCDVLDTPRELNSTADFVYTGRGALCWILDMDQWAAVPARLLRPGGHLYVYDAHPLTWIWNQEVTHLELDPEFGDYFQTTIQSEQGWGPTYIGDLGRAPDQHAPKFERQWNLGQIVNACISAGLRVERLEEHSQPYWNQFYNLPADILSHLPNTFSLLLCKD